MIRRLAKKLNLDLTYYLSGGSLLLVDQFMAALTGLATTWCFATYSPKKYYGAYSYILTIVGMLSLMALPGVSQAIQRSAARGCDGDLRIGVRRRLWAGAASGGVMLLVAMVLYLTGNAFTAKGVVFAAVLFPFAYAMDDYRSVLFGKQRFGAYLVAHTGIQTIVAAATIFAILTGLSFPLIILANLASRAVGNWLALRYVRHAMIQNERSDEDFHRFGWNLSLVGVIGGVSYYLDQLIIGTAFGLTALAAYGLAFRLTDPLRTLGVFLNKMVFPRAVKVSGAAVARRFLMRSIPLTLLLAAGGILATIAMGPVIIWVFPAYPEAVLLARWMIWSAIASVVIIYQETFYLSQERFNRTFYLVSLIRPLAIISLLPFFIWRWGVLGAIWTKLVIRLAEMVVLGGKLSFDYRLLLREEAGAGKVAIPLAPLEFVRCPLCGETEGEPHWSAPDRLHRLPGEFRVIRCRSCGLLRQQPRVAPGGIGRYYPADYRPYVARRAPVVGRGRTHRLRRQWVEWLVAGRPGSDAIGWPRTLALLPARLFGLTGLARFNPLAFTGEGRRLLDVGCASGDWLIEMQALGWRVAGVELDEQAAGAARDRGLEVVVGAFPAVENLSGPFDAVALRQVIEHLPDPVAALRRVRDLLDRRGILLLATPLADGWLPRLAGGYWYALDQPRHLQLFGRAQLAAALRQTGFRVVAVLNHSSTTSWTRSLDYWRPERRPLDARPAVHRLLGPFVRILDWLNRGDGGMILAVRDDVPAAGWAPREIREGGIR